MEKNPLIRKLEGYAPLAEEDKTVIRELCTEQVGAVAAKRDIISDGQSTDRIHLILEGWAARYKIEADGHRQITAFLIPGDFCDLHITVLKKMDHGIMALTDCEVAYLDVAKLDKITGERSMLTKALWWMTLIDEAVLRQWIINSRRRAVAAVAHLICEMQVRLESVGLSSDGGLQLPLTQEELADATGMSSIHMNRTIKTLREAGLATFGHSSVTIPNVAALAKAGDFDDSYLHLRKGVKRAGEI